jgi:hypothetical protein
LGPKTAESGSQTRRKHVVPATRSEQNEFGSESAQGAEVLGPEVLEGLDMPSLSTRAWADDDRGEERGAGDVNATRLVGGDAGVACDEVRLEK